MHARQNRFNARTILTLVVTLVMFITFSVFAALPAQAAGGGVVASSTNSVGTAHYINEYGIFQLLPPGHSSEARTRDAQSFGIPACWKATVFVNGVNPRTVYTGSYKIYGSDRIFVIMKYRTC